MINQLIILNNWEKAKLVISKICSIFLPKKDCIYYMVKALKKDGHKKLAKILKNL